MPVPSLGQKGPLEKEMAPHSSILVWEIPWRQEPGGLQPMGSQRVRHNWVTEHTHIRAISELDGLVTWQLKINRRAKIISKGNQIRELINEFSKARVHQVNSLFETPSSRWGNSLLFMVCCEFISRSPGMNAEFYQTHFSHILRSFLLFL